MHNFMLTFVFEYPSDNTYGKYVVQYHWTHAENKAKSRKFAFSPPYSVFSIL